MLSKLTLGTVQLGLKYGINNKGDKPTIKEGIEMLNYAYSKGITSIDTAADYGNSEEIIGKWLSESSINDVYITSKISSITSHGVEAKNIYDYIGDSIKRSMERLRIDTIDNILIHDFNDILRFGDIIMDVLRDMKRQGYISGYGCSVYDTKSMEFIKDYDISTLQFPSSIFNQSPLYSKVLEVMRNKGIRTFVRSGFVQGLIFMSPGDLPNNLEELGDYIIKLNRLSEEYDIPKHEIAINFLKNHREVDSIVFGVDNIEQLEQIVSIPYRCSMIYEMIRYVFKDVPEQLIDPRNWRV